MKLMSKALVVTTIFSMLGIALADDNTPEKALAEIASYRQWTRVTPQPLVVDFASLGG